MPGHKDYDPRMHSAEHLLNQTMVRMFDRGRSFTQHIEKKKSKCDYHFDRNLTEDEVSEIEKTVNEKIEADLPVTEEFVSKDEAVEKYDMKKVPDEVEGDIRIVKIGNYDTCPCIGPHVSSTSEIGGFRIVSTSYDDGVLRVRFKLK